MLIEGRSLWVAGTNTWVVAGGTGSEAVIIDAPPDLDGISALLAAHDLAPVALLATHGHVDHVGGAGSVVDRYDIAAYAHPDDDFLSLHPGEQLRILFGSVPPGSYDPPQRFESLVDGARMTFGGIEFEVVHTPGHTPGHCCFHLAGEGVLFAGDQLFAGSIGRTDLPGGDTARLMESMRSRVMVLDDATRVLPGHGPETTIGVERTSNPFRAGWQR